MQNAILREDVKNNHWKNPGDVVKYPKYTTNSSTDKIKNSDALFIDGSYFRVANLTFSWSLPGTWTNRMKIKGARISLQTQNLLTLSNYPGLDPSMMETNYATPVPRTIACNLSFNF